MYLMAIVLHSGFRREAALPREAEAFHSELARYREFVFRCALAVCGEPDGAEDVAQEVLLIMYRSERAFQSVENPYAWVRRVTVRCATKHLKRRRSSDPIPENLQAQGADPDSLAVYAVLRQLSPEQRALLGMALNQGLSYREIGDALGIPEGTVASRLNTAKKAFQRIWEQ